MKSALRGFREFTLGFRSNGQTVSALTALTALGLFFSGTAFGQVILDDFSGSNESKYTFAPVFPSNASDGWAVSGGELRPSMAENSSGTWLWNQGEKLSATGSSVSISLSLSADADNGFPTSIGLFLASDPGSVGFGHEVSQTTIGGIWSYSVDGSAQQAPAAPSGPVLLTVTRTGQTGDGFVYVTTFSGGGLASPVTDFFVDPSPSLQFGPFAYNTAGTPAALDNFAFVAVPEPSRYAAVFGFLALTAVVIRRRTARR